MSVKLLRIELVNPINTAIALRSDIVETLTARLIDFSSFLSDSLLPDGLGLLQILSMNDVMVMKIAANSKLLEALLDFIENHPTLSEDATKVLQSIMLHHFGEGFL